MNNKRTLGIAVILVLATCFLYAPSIPYDFINMDDDVYVYENPRVQEGLTRRNVRWAFTSVYKGYWIPLTWISYMADTAAFGREPNGYRVTNILLHALNVLLVFALLNRMTGAVWRSACVALIWAVHPMRIESVVWITERKDVLSTFFWLAAMWTYTRYVRGVPGKRYGTMCVVAGLMSLGMMAKPMLVTLPFVLLLMDYWPFRRFSGDDETWPGPFLRRLFKLTVEKFPLFLLSAGFSVLAVYTQATQDAIIPGDRVPWVTRLLSAPAHYISYLWRTIRPMSLSVYYPPADNLPEGRLLFAFVALAVITVGVIYYRRRIPYATVGWLWFLGVLVPVIGIVRVGAMVVGDRFLYVPHIGLILGMVWGVAHGLEKMCQSSRVSRSTVRSMLASGIVVLAIGLSGITLTEMRYWRNSVDLFSRALEIAGEHEVILNGLGLALLQDGRTEEARVYLDRALEMYPDTARLWNNTGNLYAEMGDYERASEYYRKAIGIKPDYTLAWQNLGQAQAELQQWEEAEAAFKRVVEIDPETADAWFRLGRIYDRRDMPEKAMSHFEQAVERDARHFGALHHLGDAHVRLRDMEKAATYYTKALQIRDDHADSHAGLATALAARGELQEAERHLVRALELDAGNVGIRMNYSLLLAQSERPEEAIRQLDHILEMDPDHVRARLQKAALLLDNEPAESARQYREILRRDPYNLTALNNLAWLLATEPDAEELKPGEAIGLAERAAEQSGHAHPMILGTLAETYARAGRFEEAVETANRALERAMEAGQVDLTESLEERIQRYRQGMTVIPDRE